MIKKLFLILLFGGIFIGFTGLKAQSIDIITTGTNTSPKSFCQCDTSLIRYFLTQDLNPSTEFFFEVTVNSTSGVVVDTLEIIEILHGSGGLDTFGQGIQNAMVHTPCGLPFGNGILRMINTTPPGLVSDTIVIDVNKYPDSVIISSIKGGFENPYTDAIDDWGFCEGDSVVLYVQTQQGATYQWNNNGSPISGEENDSLVVKTGGAYSVTVDLGACDRTSADTIINPFLPPSQIQRVLVPRQDWAYHVDNSNPILGIPLDSILFCESDPPVRIELDTAGGKLAKGLTYTYQWLTDTLDQNTGDPILIRADTTSDPNAARKDTSRIFAADTSLISMGNKNGIPGYARLYLVINDGFCTDTSAPFHILVDSVPRTEIVHTNFSDGVPSNGVTTEICMTDSVWLAAAYTAPNIKYQWQKCIEDPNNPLDWANIRSTINPDVADTLRTLSVDTSVKPWNPTGDLVYFRVITRTYPVPYGSRKDTICSYVSDYVAVRWLPESHITLAAGQSSSVHQVDHNSRLDSISFCEIDSAVLRAPLNPIRTELGDYKYTWLMDTVIGGVLTQVPLPDDTLRDVTVKRSGAYSVVLDDGICTDTLDRYHVFVDSLPTTALTTVTFPGRTPKASPLERCIYDSVQISAVDTVLPGWDYQWQRLVNGVWQDLPADTNPAIVVDTSYKPYYDTTYFRLQTVYRNQFGLRICPDITDSIEVIFYPLPTVNFFPGDSIGLCVGDSVLVVEQGSGITYRWLDGPRGASRWISEPGTYRVEITGDNECTRLAEVDVYQQTGKADAGPDQTVNSGDIVTLSGSGGISYRWFAGEPLDFSDFLSQTIQVSKLLPDSVASDTITIYLETTSIDGCLGRDSLQLVILNPMGRENVDLRNAYNLFTPNSDGLNDIWDIRKVTEGKGACEIMILNRWGSVVYEEKQFTGIWDGNNRGGSPLPDGTYYYVLSCNGKVVLKNAVTIIRND